MNISPNLLIAFLMKTSLFEDFTREQIQEFLPHFKVDQVRPGRPVFEEGSVGDAWYVLISGEVKVVKEMEHGPPHILANLHEGDCFGEMSLLDGAPRMARVEAVTQTVLARLPRNAFVRLTTEGNPLAGKLMSAIASVLCDRQRQLTHLLLDLVEVDDVELGPEYEALAQLLRNNVTWN